MITKALSRHSSATFHRLFNLINATSTNSTTILRFSSTAATGSGAVELKDEGHEVERHVKKDKRPVTNVPFAKELFLGRFDKVTIYLSFHTAAPSYEYQTCDTSLKSNREIFGVSLITPGHPKTPQDALLYLRHIKIPLFVHFYHHFINLKVIFY